MQCEKYIIRILILTAAILLLPVERGFAQTGCADCTLTNPPGDQNTTLTLTPDQVICFTENRTFGSLQVNGGGTICIDEGVTLTIQNNVNTSNGSTLNLEIHGTLLFMQATTMNATVIANIYDNGIIRSGNTGNANFTFNGSGTNLINNSGTFDMGVLTFGNSSGDYYFDNYGTLQISGNINMHANSVKFINNVGATINISQTFTLNANSGFHNCGTITTGSGFNMEGGKITNTGTFTVNGNLNYGQPTSSIDNYGTFNVNNGNIQMATGANFYNEGVTTITGGTFTNDGNITGPETGSGKMGYIYLDRPVEMNNGSIGPNLNFKNTAPGGSSSFAVIFQDRQNITRNEPIYWDCESTGNCVAPKQFFINLCPDFEGNFPVPRYWTGNTSSDFMTPSNWTTGTIPDPGEDVEFATNANNNNDPAVRDMRLPADASITIGALINETNLATIIPAGSSLTINDVVTGSDNDASKLLIESAEEIPTGTLIFSDPTINSNVKATVQFYNQAYECSDCGFYRRSWQYFGIPVNESDFPYDHVMGSETVNQWVEPYNGDKWQPAPYTPDTKLMAFRGYQITNDSQVQPEDLYSFTGTLNVGDALVPLTRTESVNYPGANLVGNSFMAAIPISATALQFPTGVQQTLYLFNTGTRDQWRKLNGTAVNQDGYRSGQYLAVPVNLGGENHFPDRIPSMHAFMLLVESGSGGDLSIDYSTLIKNESVKLGDGTTEIVTRASGEKSTDSSALPALVMDVIGEQSTDRVWVFRKEGTTHGFDNGWDASKIGEAGIAQLYVMGNDESRLQVATVPSTDSILLGFEAEADGTYTLEFSLSEHLRKTNLYLNDLTTGAVERIEDGGSYTFIAKRGESPTRFRLTSTGSETPFSADETLIDVRADNDGMIVIRNGSSRACTASLSNVRGEHLQTVEVDAGSEQVLANPGQGIYMVRLQNAVVNDVRRVIIK